MSYTHIILALMVGSPCKKRQYFIHKKTCGSCLCCLSCSNKSSQHCDIWIFGNSPPSRETPDVQHEKLFQQRLPICGFFFQGLLVKMLSVKTWESNTSNGKSTKNSRNSRFGSIGSQRLGSQLPNSHPTRYIIVIRDQRTPYNNRLPKTRWKWSFLVHPLQAE